MSMWPELMFWMVERSQSRANLPPEPASHSLVWLADWIYKEYAQGCPARNRGACFLGIGVLSSGRGVAFAKAGDHADALRNFRQSMRSLGCCEIAFADDSSPRGSVSLLLFSRDRMDLEMLNDALWNSFLELYPSLRDAYAGSGGMIRNAQNWICDLSGAPEPEIPQGLGPAGS